MEGVLGAHDWTELAQMLEPLLLGPSRALATSD
jgi:hypothetical protein